jgi:hypothetical protein
LLKIIAFVEPFGIIQRTCIYTDAALVAVLFRDLLVKRSVSGLGDVRNPRSVEAGVGVRRFEEDFQ